MHKHLVGIYAPYIKQYIDFKKSLGFKYDTEAKVFLFFDRFTVRRGEKFVGITRDLAVDWCNLNPNESSSYKYHRCVCLNQLASYLCKIGFQSYIMQLPPNKNTFTPYIFSRKQVADLFEACDNVTGKKKEWTRRL
jgi:integrase/recombinase XerD